MDGTTEPIIAVIGHPIAGNPSQLAIERSLESLGLEWRVLSFDVLPANVGKALDGFSVTGIRGVFLDPSVQAAATQWYQQYEEAQQSDEPNNESNDESVKEASAAPEVEENDQPIPPQLVDCLVLNEDRRFVGFYERRAWLDELLQQHPTENTRWYGDLPDTSASSAPLIDPEKLNAETGVIPPEPESIAEADLIVFSSQSTNGIIEQDLEVETWPENDAQTLVIDLTHGHPDVPQIHSKGYRVISQLEIQVGTLHRCIVRWTQQESSVEVISEAIEEYLGV